MVIAAKLHHNHLGTTLIGKSFVKTTDNEAVKLLIYRIMSLFLW
jgi:hypothetical protein